MAYAFDGLLVSDTRSQRLQICCLWVMSPNDTYAVAGQGAQVVAWEADFLNDLYQVRQLKAKVSQAVQQVPLPNPKPHLPLPCCFVLTPKLAWCGTEMLTIFYAQVKAS